MIARAGQLHQSRLPRPQLRVATTFFVLWVAALILLVSRTANPVTLNRRQLLDARLVVKAEIVDLQRGQCRVTDSWPAGLSDQEISVSDLPAAGVRPGVAYLIPLSIRDDGSYTVTPHPGRQRASRIYIANDDALTQLIAVLGDSRE